MPRNIVTDMAPMIARVEAAFFDCGRRNAWTPSAIASTPVSAVAPDENARAIRKSDKVCSTSIESVEVSATGQPPRQRTKPATSVIAIMSTKP